MTDLLQKQICTIAKKYPAITKIMLFGSRAHGDHHERSDIDLAVVAPTIGEIDWLDFIEEMEETLDTLLKLDIVHYDQSSDELKRQIDACHVLIYAC